MTVPTFDGDVTLGEVHRRLVRVEQQMAEGFKSVSDRIAAQEYIHRDVYAADKATAEQRWKAQDDEILALKATNTWLTRTLIGTVFLTLSQLLVGLALIALGSV